MSDTENAIRAIVSGLVWVPEAATYEQAKEREVKAVRELLALINCARVSVIEQASRKAAVCCLNAKREPAV